MNISDNDAIFLNRKILKHKPEHKIITGRSYSEYNKLAFIQDLHKVDWQSLRSEKVH